MFRVEQLLVTRAGIQYMSIQFGPKGGEQKVFFMATGMTPNEAIKQFECLPQSNTN